MDSYYTIDFGCNYADTKKYSKTKLKKILDESYELGVNKIVCISNCLKEAKINIALAAEYPNLHFTLGIHPHHALEFKEDDLIFLEEHITHKKCFGIGECGLDFNRMFSSKEEQIYAFVKQLELAKKCNAKLYLHCRDAYDDFIKIIKNNEYYNGLIHCFTGTIEQAIEFTSLGFKLGITGWLLDNRRNADLVNVVKDKRIKLDMLIVETDAPWMAIRPARESRPENTADIVERIAKLKNLDTIECGKIMYETALKFLEK